MPTFRNRVEDGQLLLVASVEGVSPRKAYRALLDTGAQRTMISPKVVSEASLQAIGYSHVIPVSGEPIRTPKYRIDLSLPIPQGNTTLLSGLSGMELEVARLPFQPANFDILLGMDFLIHCHFTMYGGSFILSI